jgi:hypothetical protein
MEPGQAFSSTIEIFMDADGRPRAFFKNSRAAPSVINLQWGDWVRNVVANVVSLQFNASVAGSIGAGSVAHIYKVARVGGGVGGTSVAFDKRTKIFAHYNLLNGANVVTGTTFESNALPTIYRTVSAGTTATSSDAEGTYIRIGTGTNALTSLRFFACLPFMTPQAGKLRYSTRIRVPTLSDAAQTFNVDIGFTNAVTGATRVLFLSYAHATNGGMWTFKGVDSVGTTTVNTTVPLVAGTIYNIDIVIESSTVAKAYIDDTLVATLTTNIPYTDAIAPANQLTKQVGTTTRTLDTYFMEIDQDVTRG